MYSWKRSWSMCPCPGANAKCSIPPHFSLWVTVIVKPSNSCIVLIANIYLLLFQLLFRCFAYVSSFNPQTSLWSAWVGTIITIFLILEMKPVVESSGSSPKVKRLLNARAGSQTQSSARAHSLPASLINWLADILWKMLGRTVLPCMGVEAN